MKIRELLNWSAYELVNSSSPDIDGWALLKAALQVDDAWLIAHDQNSVDSRDEAGFRELIQSRKRGVPVSYLTHSRQFWSKDLYVDSRVLVPRHETEVLVDAALVCAKELQYPSILELGTGSGAVAIALSSELPNAKITAIDNSSDALAVAQINLERHQCSNVVLKQSDWFSAVRGQRYDLICANPPYIASSDPHLEAPELRHEPKSALIAGKDGLEAIGKIVCAAPDHLHAMGWLVLEHGHDQAPAVQQLFEYMRWADIHSSDDLMGNNRVIQARRPTC